MVIIKEIKYGICRRTNYRRTNKKISSLLLLTFVVIFITSIFVSAFNFGDPSPDTGEADYGALIGTFDTQRGNETNTRTDNNVYFSVGRNNGVAAAVNQTLSFNISKLSTNSSIKIKEINLSLRYCHGRRVTSNCGTGAGNSPQGTAGTMNILVYNSTKWISIRTLPAQINDAEVIIIANISSYGNDFTSYIDANGFVNISFEFAWSGTGLSAFENDHTNLTITYSSVPSIILSSPANNAIFTGVSNVSFTCNATNSNGLLNITLFHNISGTFIQNQTTNVTGTAASANFNVTNIPFGNYAWNCLTVSTDNLSAFATANFTFTVKDNIPPNINYAAPTPNNKSKTSY